jgi:hypothetical protein
MADENKAAPRLSLVPVLPGRPNPLPFPGEPSSPLFFVDESSPNISRMLASGCGGFLDKAKYPEIDFKCTTATILPFSASEKP